MDANPKPGDIVHFEEQFKNNGWSLYGLAQALERQGKTAEAGKYKAQYEKMWGKADVKPLAEKT